nr:alpha/beta family hydrolase [Conexibacter arvalis]
MTLDTPHGPARVHLHRPDGPPTGALLLGHGAGGGVAAPDLVAATAVANELGATVGLVEQPYRVAGRRNAAPARQLDAAWEAVVAGLRERGELDPALPLVAGGRSSGARVACRTAAATGAAGILCLAFPLQPPVRAGREPRPSRLPELEAVPAGVPVLIVQGVRDRFGMPEAAPGREVVAIKGDHGLKSDRAALRAALAAWLPGVLGTR